MLLPGTSAGNPISAPGGTLLRAAGQAASAAPITGTRVRGGWDVAMFSSGSTTGSPRGYGFTIAQLDVVTSWYQAIYQVTPDSIIVTSLAAAYNFTFVAGVPAAAASAPACTSAQAATGCSTTPRAWPAAPTA